MTPIEFRRPRLTRGRAAVAALVVLLGVAAAVIAVTQSRGLPDDAAFEYDGEVVTTADLDDRVEVLGALYGIKEPEAGKDKDTFRRDTAKAVAVSMILEDAAADEDIVISDKSARDTLAKMVDGQMGADPQRAFTEMLSRFGVTEDSVLQEVKRQQALALLFQKLTAEAVEDVTPTDVRAFYGKDPGRFGTPERRQLRNIVVATRAEADAVLAQVRSGTDFAAAARQSSLDDATREQGGAVGEVGAGELEEAYAEAAFAAGAGELFGPVQTRHGWNVGQVLKVLPAAAATFAAVEDQVTDELRSERALKAWREWLADRIRDADVEYAAAYRPAHPDEPPASTLAMP
jgi:parvulin-like peptidyl-prolyl isomerase